MINLSNHVCEKCRHLNRYQRTHHGWLTESYRNIQIQIDRDVQHRRYRNLPYLREQAKATMVDIIDVEAGNHPHDYLRHHT